MYKEIRKYMWSGGGPLDGGVDVLYDITELFEAVAAEGKTATEFVGPDVASFCDALCKEERTWLDTRRELLNKHIQEHLNHSEGK